MAELADALDLGSSPERGKGSNPFSRNLIGQRCCGFYAGLGCEVFSGCPSTVPPKGFAEVPTFQVGPTCDGEKTTPLHAVKRERCGTVIGQVPAGDVLTGLDWHFVAAVWPELGNEAGRHLRHCEVKTPMLGRIREFPKGERRQRP